MNSTTYDATIIVSDVRPGTTLPQVDETFTTSASGSLSGEIIHQPIHDPDTSTIISLENLVTQRLRHDEDLLIIFRTSDQARVALPTILRAEEEVGKGTRKLLVTDESESVRKSARSEFEQLLGIVKFRVGNSPEESGRNGSVTRLHHMIHGKPDELPAHPHELT